MSDLTQEELDRFMVASADFNRAYWREFAKTGPRHANVKRWIVDLEWTAAPGVWAAYLAPEQRHG